MQLGVLARDSLRRTVLLGPTGAGESNAMLNLILAEHLHAPDLASS